MNLKLDLARRSVRESLEKSLISQSSTGIVVELVIPPEINLNLRYKISVSGKQSLIRINKCMFNVKAS